MTTYNTGNPLGSTDPRDLYDNAENLDNLVNGDQAAYNDRLGRPRKSWAGMESEFQAAQDDREGVFNAYLVSAGYQFAGDYAAGIEVTQYNQLIRDSNGEFWRVSGSTELPYTTTGAGLPEGGNFVAVGDAALRQELANPDMGAAMVAFAPAGTGSAHRTVQSKLREFVSVKDFGAVGDGVTDDTAAIQGALAYLASVGGGKLTFGRSEAYLVTDTLPVTDSIEIDLNGSTINFACDEGAKRLLAIDGSNVSVSNGTVNNILGTPSPQGTYQTPIVLGQYTVLAGVSNVVLKNLSISTMTPLGNGIAIFGDSHNIIIQNITFPDSDKIGIPVLAHWSFDGGPSGPYLGTTTHPHNITIDNIYCGNLTYDPGVGHPGVSVVFLSAAYNVNVSNIYVKSIPHGKIVSVYAGDWGFQFGTAIEQAFGSTGINISNLYGQALIGFEAYMRNPLEAPNVIWPSSISLKNMNVLGDGSTNPWSRGINIDATSNVYVEDCVISNFNTGVNISIGSNYEIRNIKIRNSIIKNNVSNGFTVDGAGTLSNVEISNCMFEMNNTSGAENVSDIRLSLMSQVLIYKNVFASPKSTWNVRADNTVTGLRVRDNHVVAVKLESGPCFSFGTQDDTNICIEFSGNTAEVSPAGGIRGGQSIVPMVFSARHNQNTLQRIAYYHTVPDRGTWSVGDRVFNTAPAVGQPKSWVCTVAGTPGAWVSEGNL